ncbi:hypothetical protein [Pseudoalteromonas phage vB_PalP_Y7]|nr:hypothetical protein [Pseudoalteromonas phage vB_PalP_Y7]
MADLDQQLIAAFARMDKPSRYTWLEDNEKLPPFKATKRGYMQVPLNKETHEEMRAGTIFIGVWRTQAPSIMRVDRLFQAELYMYEVGIEAVKHRVIAQMIDPDNANVLWQAIDEMSMHVMTLDTEKDTEWDVGRCKAVVRV